jgi:hypothetical protein
MWSAGVRESPEAYGVDLFGGRLTEREARPVLAFRQQVARLAELDRPHVPEFFRRHLLGTRVVTSDDEMADFVDLHRRYRRECVALEQAVDLPRPAEYCLSEVCGGPSI